MTANTPQKPKPKQQDILHVSFTPQEAGVLWEKFTDRLEAAHSSNLRLRKVILHMAPNEWDEGDFAKVFAFRKTCGDTSSLNQTYTVWHDNHVFISSRELDRTDVQDLIRSWKLSGEYLRVTGLDPRRELLRSWRREGRDPSGHIYDL